MRGLLAIGLLGAMAACGSDSDDCDPRVCDPDAAIVMPDFAGVWQASRTETSRDCSLDVDPATEVRIRIEGNATDGYTAVDAFNSGSPGNGGTLETVDGVQWFNVSFQEYWPGSPDVAPGVFFHLRREGTGLSGTSRAEAYYSVNSELVHCTFNFSLTAVPSVDP